ncbi:MAG: prepilin-type N-terminal cleavage/methylation domain-containing protein [Firmicutes bacterium]|nr:prepilin-type N-terminal cleavage/methylation domain-containing protein [Bacillota bacterium]
MQMENERTSSGEVRRPAFTLLEVLVALSLSALAASLLIGTVSRATSHQALQRATDQVLAALEDARTLAQRGNAVTCTVENNTRLVTFATPAQSSGSWVPPSRHVLQLPEGISLRVENQAGQPAPTQWIRIGTDGRISQGMTLVLRDRSEGSIRIVVMVGTGAWYVDASKR